MYIKFVGLLGEKYTISKSDTSRSNQKIFPLSLFLEEFSVNHIFQFCEIKALKEKRDSDSPNKEDVMYSYKQLLLNSEIKYVLVDIEKGW